MREAITDVMAFLISWQPFLSGGINSRGISFAMAQWYNQLSQSEVILEDMNKYDLYQIASNYEPSAYFVGHAASMCIFL